MKQLVVTAAVIERDGQILIAQRNPDSHMALKWEFPGGKVEWGEQPRDCLKREIREELDIEIAVGDVVDVVSHTYEDRQIVLIAYRCTYVAGDIKLVDAHAVRWVNASDLRQVDLAPADVPIMERLLRA